VSVRNPTRVLVLTSYYLPGFRAGGPIRSIANLIDALSGEFEFSVLTRDRDLGDRMPYMGVRTGCWSNAGTARVMYLAPGMLNAAVLRRAIEEMSPDVIYLNSVFDPVFTIRPLWWRHRGLFDRTIPTVVAPRGELFGGALQVKAVKKRIFLQTARWSSLYQGVRWQASTEDEAGVIAGLFGVEQSIVVAPNVATVPPSPLELVGRPPKHPGKLRLVQVARVARNKNLLGAIRALRGVSAEVEFSVFGALEDRSYWRSCLQAIAELPANLKVTYRGELPHAEVSAQLAKHHVYYSLTHGENYGHGIVEGMLAGLPALISDRTPWRELSERGIGWDLRLDDLAAVTSAIERAAAFDCEEYGRWSRAASEFANEHVRASRSLEPYRRLFVPGVQS
jgi:glycosyltransferase involved in cell wall biosynthesis